MGDQFGFQPQELAEIQRDWQQLNEKMNAMGKRVAEIRTKVAAAAAMDVASGSILGIVGAAVIVARIQSDVKSIAERAGRLEATKNKLAEELGQDARKIKMVIDAYEAVEHGIADGLKGTDPGEDKQKPPKTGLDSVDHGGGGGGGTGGGGTGGGGGSGGGGTGGGGGGGGGGGTGGGGGGGGHDTSGNDGSGVVSGPGGKHDGPKIKDRSDGDWKTEIRGGGWDSWSNKWHPRNGQGAGPLAQPKLDGVSDERRAMVDRAMERVNRKLGYSQCSFTNGYRVDCSGFVSAAWGIPGEGTTTGPLISEGSGIAHHISKGEMQPGDAMVVHHVGGDNNQHVVLFGGWANAEHTRAIILEDSGSRGCVSREADLSAFSAYTAIRKNGM
ncbi:hypothetical protein [Kitasatospora sp. NPDC057223]|uniref:hypothetical protein n=1 Tax=Kitasatospora sp. NPDC057223 TaxID=3346055 RepID=UPI0036354D1E